MYCETAALDQFFWIFVNKDENYHWIAIIEASTNCWNWACSSTAKQCALSHRIRHWRMASANHYRYTEELNDFDLRRLEALRTQA
jgi:exodeoxyribonuclease VIII